MRGASGAQDSALFHRVGAQSLAQSTARFSRHVTLLLNYLADDAAAHETHELCRRLNPQVALLKADISQLSQVELLVQKCLDRFHSIDVLINNASINIDKPLHDLTEEDWTRVVDINMKGVFFCSQVASRYMLRQEHEGIILNVGATTGIRGRKNGINYCASKAGVLVMTKCLAMELAPKIRVNCVIPGFTRTGETEPRFELNRPENVSAKENSIPLKRLGTPPEIADVVAFLLSPEARYIHGQKIIIDGGQYMY